MSPSPSGKAKPPAPSRKRLTAEARREQIIESARRVFVRSGFAGARTRDLAAEAGVNEALLYNHFGSKEELLEAAVAEPLERAVAQLRELSGDPPENFDVDGQVMYERTAQFARDLLGVMDDVAPLLGVMLCGDVDTASDYYRQRIAPSLEGVAAVVEANLASWNHRDFDVDLLVNLVFGMSWFLSLSDRLAGRQRDREETASHIAAMIIFGLDTGHLAPGAETKTPDA